MYRRMDRLADLGTAIVTISGGEPLMHPDLEKIIARIRRRGMIAGLISNGYLMAPRRIQSLNESGLEHLQISIDNVVPDDVSKKSLKVLDRKLQDLARYADFQVNINSVLGGGMRSPEDALTIARRAVELGFSCSVGIIHDGGGRAKPLSAAEIDVWNRVRALGKKSYVRFNKFQKNLTLGEPNQWRCRAGGRYLYICEDGLVHYCSQQRGYPGIPLADYTQRDIEREFYTEKSCAPHCTVSCVNLISLVDAWRAPQHGPVSAVSDVVRIQ